tara:strand:- start:451 stop:1506 length:1056 start_codon:yes stop_codon:yes gene_type:complete
MGFLDKKEQVINFELTSYGRHLLSLGKLKPEYYAFFDDDVMYNNESESQGTTKGRILNETPYCDAQSTLIGIENKLFSSEQYGDSADERYPQTYEKINSLNYSLGTSDSLSHDKTPYWKVTNLQGETSKASKIFTTTQQFTNPGGANYNANARLSGSLPFKNIPQIEMNLDYEISIGNIYLEYEEYEDPASPNLPLTEIMSDGSYLSINEEQILMHFLEENSFTHKDSFEVEVYLYDHTDNNKLIPLKLIKRHTSENKIKNDLLVDGTEELDAFGLNELGLGPIGPDMVEYYFDLRTDKQIPEEDICDGILNLKRKEIFLDLDYDCLEREEARDANIYVTGITEDDIEDCE